METAFKETNKDKNADKKKRGKNDSSKKTQLRLVLRYRPPSASGLGGIARKSWPREASRR
jgi:hypothetical protein